MYATKIEDEHNIDVLEQTFGAWHRKEPAQQVVEKARKAFRQSMTRRQQ